MQKKIAALKRATSFSPNHVGNDAIIIEMTARELAKYGLIISWYDEKNLSSLGINEDLVFTMARNNSSLKYLAKIEMKGGKVLNSTRGVKNCRRENMMNILNESKILTPMNATIDTSNYGLSKLIAEKYTTNELWVKREGHVIHREDIAKVYSPEELGCILKEFNGRSISKANVQENIVGDGIKFYAIPEANYCHWYYSDVATKFKFDQEKFRADISECARLFDLNFYGGDAIVTKDGNVYFIDVNDWPSFAPVREIASRKIAYVIHEHYELMLNNRKSYLNLAEV